MLSEKVEGKTPEGSQQVKPAEPTENDPVIIDQSLKVLDDITRSGLSTNVSSGSGNDQTFETKDNESPSSGQGACLGVDILCKTRTDKDGISANKSCCSTRPQAEVGAYRPDLKQVATGHTRENTWAQPASDEAPKVEHKYGLFGTTKSTTPNREDCLAKSEALIQSKDGMKTSGLSQETCEGRLNTISFKTPITIPIQTQSFGFSFSPKFEERPTTATTPQTPSPPEGTEKQNRSPPMNFKRSPEGSRHHSRGGTLGLVQDFGPFPTAMKTSKETGDHPPELATPPIISYLPKGMDKVYSSIEFKCGERMESMLSEPDDSSTEDSDEIYMASGNEDRDCPGCRVTTGVRTKAMQSPDRVEF